MTARLTLEQSKAIPFGNWHGCPPPPDGGPAYKLARSLGKPVALGLLQPQDADRHIVGACFRCGGTAEQIVDRIRYALWFLDQAASGFSDDRAVDEGRIRRAVWALCEAKRPGGQIIDAAERTRPRTMRSDDVVLFCREVAQQTMRSARRVGRR